MKTKNIIFLILGIVLTIALAISGWIYFNYRNDKSVDSQIDQSKVSFTPIPKVTTTTVPVISGSFVTPTQTEDANSPKTISKGNFIKIDNLHYGSGDVELVKQGENYFVIFSSNVDIASGPDLYLYMSEKQDYENLDTSRTLDLGSLKSNKGEQVYQISKEEFEKYNGAVIIWCKAFGVQFSRAELNRI